MRGVVIYESMFGNTRRIAQAIGDGLASALEVRLIRADQATGSDLDGISLVVVGAPTHAWGLPSAKNRQGALSSVRRPGSDLVLEPDADSLPGVREWLNSLGDAGTLGAVFDTRFSAPVIFTGHASKSIARSMLRHGIDVVLPPESFLVDRKNHLVPGEVERARVWALDVGAEVTSRTRLSWPS